MDRLLKSAQNSSSILPGKASNLVGPFRNPPPPIRGADEISNPPDHHAAELTKINGPFVAWTFSRHFALARTRRTPRSLQHHSKQPVIAQGRENGIRKMDAPCAFGSVCAVSLCP